jgi:hypothetical protein
VANDVAAYANENMAATKISEWRRSGENLAAGGINGVASKMRSVASALA